MIVYFADRSLTVLGSASTDLPYGLRITDDTREEDLESGIKTFKCTLTYSNMTRALVMDTVAVGNFLLRSHEDENEFYTILTTEHDTETQSITVYAEDAGLDLLNTLAPAYEPTAAQNIEWYISQWLPAGWTIGRNEIGTSTTKKLPAWDGESSLTERLLSIVNQFDGEIGFSYEINQLNITARKVDIYKHRGNSEAVYQLKLGYEVSRIQTNKSIENLATAFTCYGSAPEGKDTPINLSGCSYSSDGTTTHDPAVSSDDYVIVGKQVRCKSAMNKWKSALDTDGLLVREYTYETTSKKELFSHAVAELRKVVDEEVTYDLEIIDFPKNARLGDRINVVDDADEVYLEGRILNLETSVISKSTRVTLGDYIIKTSGISSRMEKLAAEARKRAVSATTLSIASSSGLIFHNQAIATTLTATAFYGETAITSQEQLNNIFGADAVIKWYLSGTAVGTGFTLQVSSNNPIEKYKVRLEA